MMEDQKIQKPLEVIENKENKPSENQKIQNRSSIKSKQEQNKGKSQLMNSDLQIFNLAFIQRKTMNLQRLKEYMNKRKVSFQTRSKIYFDLRVIFFEKQKHTKNFLKNIIKYFTELVDLYQYYLKYNSKFQLKKKPKDQFLYGALFDSILELTQLNEVEGEHVQKFVDWLQKILISAFHSTQNLFKDRLKKLNNEIQKSDDEYFSAWGKQEKAYEKISTGNDLLEKELFLLEKIKITNQKTIQRGLSVFNVWEQILEEEKNIKKIIKENILQFHERFINFHKKNDKAKSLLTYWKSLGENPTVLEVFGSVLGEKDIQFISFGCKTNKLKETFEHFMRMASEQKRIGNPFPFIDILISKKFKAKMQRSQRQWSQIKLIFSVDHNLIIYDEKQKKTVLKLKQNTLKIKRVSQNILELVGIEEGFFIDSNKKQSIHFDSLDSVQEFVYFLNSISEGQK